MVIPPLEMLLRLGTGMILGAAIGFERKRTGHPAGLRTHLLVALASTTFMLASTQFVYFQTYGKEQRVRQETIVPAGPPSPSQTDLRLRLLDTPEQHAQAAIEACANRRRPSCATLSTTRSLSFHGPA